MQDLDNLGGGSCSPWAMNDNGQIVGISEVPNSNYHAFFWSKETEMIDLGTYIDFWDINNLGQAVGQSGGARAVLWTYQEGMKYLGTLGGSFNSAYAINNSGEVVGSAELLDGGIRGFRWTEEGGMEDLGTLGSNFSIAFAINEVGHIAGDSGPQNGVRHAFLWTKENGMEDLGTLGGSYSSVMGIRGAKRALNDMGQVVGMSRTAEGEGHAFLWTPGIGMRDLGTLGGTLSWALAINNLGQVVGWSTTPEEKGHAFFWSEETGMIDLGTLEGGVFSRAYDINDSGQIMGESGIAPWGQHAVLWTVKVAPPTPQEQVDSIITDVNSLIDSATINNGQGNSLISKLEAVKLQLEKGNTTPVCNLLQAFINQVRAFMNGQEPILTQAEGQPLIDAANSLIAELCG